MIRARFALALLLALGACGGDDDASDDESTTTSTTAEETTTTEAEETTTTAVASGELTGFDAPFTTFTVDGSFSVDLPGTPQETTQEAQTPLGPVPIDFYIVEATDQAIAVGVSIQPEGAADQPPQELLSTIVGGAAGAVNGTIEHEAEVVGAPQPARDAQVSLSLGGRDVVLLLRVVIVGDQLFQLQSLGLVGNLAEVQADFDRLVGSFEPVV